MAIELSIAVIALSAYALAASRASTYLAHYPTLYRTAASPSSKWPPKDTTGLDEEPEC